MKSSSLRATVVRLLLAIFILASVALVSTGFYLTRDHLEDIAEAVKSSGTTNSGKANLISYNYQTFQPQSKQDINLYASTSGITVKSIDQLPTQKTDTLSQNLTGTITKSIQINIQGSVPYVNFLKFTKAIESNLPIIRITNMKLSRDNSNPSNVIVESLVVSTTVRQST